ncbi:MAG: hypothetical protein CFE30_06615 [Bradyrhizobium sp. PARBB1]|nr:MAG: hypothetical protein CFE30_06615 [Bradyrhizobium sp. PARBB1]PSO23560.1 hypothetical protein C7G43_23485 [Bradyrhizobium sp. MOS004]HAQ83834.1 hypothetical protein [Bradyrhizobium sp.]HAR18071.1 hypothetical protein [Bradyrhizobium sp.]HAR28047.1 hypothetical protein [Bradyrhizobium sp.]
MAALPELERMQNIVPFLFSESSEGAGSVWKVILIVNLARLAGLAGLTRPLIGGRRLSGS